MAVAKQKPAAPETPIFHVVPKEAPAPPGSASPATTGVKKISLGGLVKTTAEKKTEHPLITEPSQELLDTLKLFAEKSPEFKALKGTVESLSKSAGALGKPFWFRHWHGRGDAGSTMLVNIGTGKDIRLVFKNAYTSKLSDDAPLVALLGPERTGAHFRQSTTLAIKMDEIPEALQEPFINAVLEKAAELGITSGIEAKQCIKPGPGVHESRHTLFTPEENMALDEILPITAYPQV